MNTSEHPWVSEHAWADPATLTQIATALTDPAGDSYLYRDPSVLNTVLTRLWAVTDTFTDGTIDEMIVRVVQQNMHAVVAHTIDEGHPLWPLLTDENKERVTWERAKVTSDRIVRAAIR